MVRSLLYLVFVLGFAFALSAGAADLEKGKEINGVCAACHGDYGQGGKKGEYPRIAGQNVKFLESQLRAFRARQRVNIPMFPYTQERELPDEDIKDVSAYLAMIELPTTIPDFKPTDGAYERLLAMEKVMIIPRSEGDIEAGKVIYQKQCAACHGKSGRGKGMFPMLVGQYTHYLMKQMTAYRKHDRAHEEEGVGGMLDALQEPQMRDVLAYLTSIQGAAE